MKCCENNKVSFKDLSGAMKTAIVFTWIMAGAFTLSFLVGFIGALLG